MKMTCSYALALVFLSTFAGDVSAQFSPPSSGLVAWWRGEGNANDSSGNGHDGTLLNGAAFDTGRFGQAFSFLGSQNRVFVPDSNDFKLTNSLTISAWVFPKLDSWVVIYRGGRSFSPYALEMDNAGNFAFFISGSSANDQLSVPIALNQWKQVTGTLDGLTGEMRLYFDGLLVAHKITQVRPRAEIDTNTPPPLAGVFIGNATDGNNPFIGLVDEVLLYSRALSAAEVQGLVSQGAPFIISQSTNQTVAVGDSALFRVSISGGQPLSYQWSLGGSNVAGATTSNLTLANVQIAQAGSYSVQVANSLGTTSSAPAVLTVNTQLRSYVPLQPGLVAWWRGENNGNDNSGNGHDGMLRDGGGYTVGDFGQAFSFLGNHNRLLVPDSEDFNLTNSLTLAAWIYIRANSYAIIQRANTGFSPYSLGLDGGGHVTFGLNSGQAAISAPIPNNQWKHVAATLDGSSGQFRLYIDGILVNSQTTSVRPASLDSSQQPLVSIGNVPYSGGFPFIGFIDEVLVYSRALSSQEVRALVQGPPAITLQPVDQTAWSGDTVAFTVAATGTAPLGYQWLLNGTNLDGATASSLVFTNVQAPQAGSYSVQVTNAAGATNSVSAALTVNPQPYPFSVPGTGLVAWWRAENNANDSSGNSHHGALVSVVNFDTGKFGRAFSIAGNGNRVLVPDSPDFKLTNSLSISAWVYPKANSWVILQRTGGQTAAYSFQLDDAGHFAFTITGSSGQDTLSAPIAFNQWVQLSATLDGATGDMRLYFNGSVAAEKLTSVRPRGDIDPLNQPTISIGNTPDGSFPFIGLIDEVLVYSRALSHAEIQGLALIPPSPPVITTQPASQTIIVGGTAAFSVVADGAPPPGYQWLFNGASLAGATSSRLTISNAQRSNAGTYAVVVTNSLGSVTSSNATLTVNFAPAVVRVLSTTNVGGSTVSVPVVLTANGNETALGFSLNFTPSRLSYSDTALGSGATGATLLVNSSQTTTGRLGIALSLPAGETFAPGDKQVVLVHFTGAVQANDVSSAITFGDSPIIRQLSDVNGASLPVNFVSGTVTLTANDFEADVSPRPTGDKRVTVTDWVLIGRFAARLDSPTNASEFQRADCAPRATLGNGNITVSDWVQAGRYVAGFDPLTPVGGPTAYLLTRAPLASSGSKGPSSKRKLQVVNTTMAQGQPGSTSVNLRAQGDENAVAFSLSFDPSQFSFVDATLGSGASTATLNLNTIEAGLGRLAAVLSLPSGTSFPAGTREVLKVRLQPSRNASGSYALSLLDQPVLRETSDATANTLVTDYIDGSVTVNPSPFLSISQDGVNLTLKWADWASGYTLQESTGPLSAAQVWSNLSPTQTVVNREVVVVLPLAASPKFYRLYKP